MKKLRILLWMIFFLLVCHTLITININVAIISMVRLPQNKVAGSNETKLVICPNTTFSWIRANTGIISPSNKEDTFKWNNYEKNIILSSFHSITWLSILPGSILAQKYGSKIVVGYAIFIASVLSSLVPLLAKYGPKFVICVRMIQGLLVGISSPGGIMTATGNWSSEQDRGKFVAAILAGMTVSSGFGTYLFGYIGKYVHWKYIFHITSIFGIIWTIFWYFFVYDFPETHPTISIKEKYKILEKRKQAANNENIPIPWTDMLTSVPLIMCLLNLGAVVVNSFVIVTFMPLYISNLFGFDSNQTGIMVSLSRLSCATLAFPLGWFTDFFTRKRWLSITNTRKLFSFIGCLLSSALLVLMAFTKCDVIATFIYYTLSASLRGVFVFGLEPALVDMSPKFCGVTHGLSGTVNELMTLVFAMIMGYLSKKMPIEQYWKAVFLLTAALPLLPTILFSIWGSAERQPWNEGSKKNQSLNRNQKSLPAVPFNADSVQLITLNDIEEKIGR